jgi:hypothetical protein|tara:strand:- start:313 stop:549 length:237 start_codon:yes stop_codon:yes gene_type:complete
MKKFNFKLKDGATKTMEFDELVRWACLIEALDVVGGKEDIDIESDKWIKPLAFQKYIDERFHSMKHDLKVEAALGNLD